MMVRMTASSTNEVKATIITPRVERERRHSTAARMAVSRARTVPGLTRSRIGWGAVGAAMACYQTALEYAKARRQFEDKPIAAHQLVQDKLVWMITEISKAQLLALHVGRLKDQGRAHPAHVSMLKMNNVWMAQETARKARDILGANGIVDDYCIMRHMNNLESVSTYEGTHDIHRLVIGERITGISAFV